MKCWVCKRQARGYGHSDLRHPVGDARRYPIDWVFCSRRCQEAFHALYGHWLRVREGRTDKPARYSHRFIGANHVMADSSLGDMLLVLRGGLLPGVETRLEPVDGIPGGKLYVRGPNIMSGYLNADGVMEEPPGGWHDTGDVVEISDDGWIKILGRVKRFAKIGGEMVSLTAAEDITEGLGLLKQWMES